LSCLQDKGSDPANVFAALSGAGVPVSHPASWDFPEAGVPPGLSTVFHAPEHNFRPLPSGHQMPTGAVGDTGRFRCIKINADLGGLSRHRYSAPLSVLLRDTIQRHHIRNIDLLERIIHFLLDNTGNLFSARTITAYMKHENRKAYVETIYNYIHALESTFIIKKSPGV
jgi:hypothetical protein